MPTYTYACAKCGHAFDVFHSMTATPKVVCEACGSTKCARQIGTGAGIIFKGSGFYETDYKQKSGKEPAASAQNGAPKKDSPKKTEATKPAAKATSEK